MTGISALQADLARWEKELQSLEEECAIDGWTEPEKLLFILQLTASTYRRLLPRLMTDRAAAQPVRRGGAGDYAEFVGIVADELVLLVDKTEELRIELIRSGQTIQLQLQAVETLAAIRALSKVINRLRQRAEVGS